MFQANLGQNSGKSVVYNSGQDVALNMLEKNPKRKCNPYPNPAPTINTNLIRQWRIRHPCKRPVPLGSWWLILQEPGGGGQNYGAAENQLLSCRTLWTEVSASEINTQITYPTPYNIPSQASTNQCSGYVPISFAHTVQKNNALWLFFVSFKSKKTQHEWHFLLFAKYVLENFARNTG